MNRSPLCRFACGMLLLLASFQNCPGQDSSRSAWEFNASFNLFWYPSDQTIFSPVFTADREQLHLEGRYNYEGKQTASLFCGWTLEWSGTIQGAATPMLGVVFGNTRGIAPGLELDVLWGPVELYIEAEYLIDTQDRTASYLYSWNDLSVGITDWLKAGLAWQSTRIVDTGRDIQRGLMAEGSFGRYGIAFHMFNPDDVRPYYVFTLGIGF